MNLRGRLRFRRAECEPILAVRQQQCAGNCTRYVVSRPNRTAAVSVVGGQCSHLLGMSFCLKSVSLHKSFDQFQPSPFEASRGS